MPASQESLAISTAFIKAVRTGNITPTHHYSRKELERALLELLPNKGITPDYDAIKLRIEELKDEEKKSEQRANEKRSSREEAMKIVLAFLLGIIATMFTHWLFK
jgi:hypothetical protein